MPVGNGGSQQHWEGENKGWQVQGCGAGCSSRRWDRGAEGVTAPVGNGGRWQHWEGESCEVEGWVRRGVQGREVKSVQLPQKW